MTELSNRDILIRSASALIRRKGYAGVGLSEILREAGLPKGSLYYHFPGGKRELAEAATLWAGAVVTRRIERSFEAAAGFPEGAAATCREIATLAAREGGFDGCPVASILQAGAGEPALRALAQQVLADWTARVEAHAARLGEAGPDRGARLFVMQLQGAWMLALAEQDVAPFSLLEQELVGRS